MSVRRIFALHKMSGPALIVPAVKKHSATVIMAHGLGDRWANNTSSVDTKENDQADNVTVAEDGELCPPSHLTASRLPTDDRSACYRVGLAENWRRRGKFDDVKFIFPNAPSIPITVVRTGPATLPVLVNRPADLSSHFAEFRRVNARLVRHSKASQRRPQPTLPPKPADHELLDHVRRPQRRSRRARHPPIPLPVQ